MGSGSRHHHYHHHHYEQGSRDGAVVRALASHQCGPGSIPGVNAICGLSSSPLFPRIFSGTPVFLSPQKTTFPNSNSTWNAQSPLNDFLAMESSWCSVGEQIASTNKQAIEKREFRKPILRCAELRPGNIIKSKLLSLLLQRKGKRKPMDENQAPNTCPWAS